MYIIFYLLFNLDIMRKELWPYIYSWLNICNVEEGCIDMRYDIFCTSDVYRNWISVSLAVFRGSTGISWWRNTIFQELPIEEQDRHRWCRTSRRDIHGAFRWRHYVYTTCSYDRFRTNAILVCRLRSWRIWIPRMADIVRFSNPSGTTTSVHRQECEREGSRHRYKGGETVRGPAMLPDNSGIRDGEWSIGEWYGRLLG